MTCYVCAKPNCVDDCASFPPPALKVGSAEHKLQELLKIADSLSENFEEFDPDWMYPICMHCHVRAIRAGFNEHAHDCPILKLEQFKKTLENKDA